MRIQIKNPMVSTKKQLPDVTLIGIDCVDPYRLQEAANISESGVHFANVKMLSSIPINDLRFFKIKPLSTLEEYSRFCISELNNYVDTKYCLLIQWDGFVLNPDSWEDAFLEYDYTGSPWVVKDWSINDFDFPENLRGQRVVGNGGFSLRSKFFLETASRLLEENKISRFHPEDIALSVWYRSELEKLGIRFAPSELAQRFSIEGADNVYEKQFGFHGFYSTNIDKWFNTHSEYHTVRQVYERTKLLSHDRTWKPSKD